MSALSQQPLVSTGFYPQTYLGPRWWTNFLSLPIAVSTASPFRLSFERIFPAHLEAEIYF